MMMGITNEADYIIWQANSGKSMMLWRVRKIAG
jgi:hypothetical protein